MLGDLVFLLLINIAMGTNTRFIDDEEKRIYNFGLGKRAYSYVSEYKRLPVYNFGLGKRVEARNMYSFGLGKRNENADAKSNNIHYFSTANKRGKNYNFGLGKRFHHTDYNFSLHQAVPQSLFGSETQQKNHNFGLEKRQDKYSFGLGKKDKVYSFGLGKRHAPNNKADGSDYEDVSDEEKRSHKYSFGLGNRHDEFEVTEEPDRQLEQDSREINYKFSLDKANSNLDSPEKLISSSESRLYNKKYEQ